MTDCTFSMMVSPVINVGAKKGYTLGELTGVYFPMVTTGCRSPRCVFVHVIGIPATEDEIKSAIMGAVYVIPSVTREILYRNRWMGNLLAFTAEASSELMTNKEITRTWDDAKTYLINQVTGLPITEDDLHGNN